MVGLIAAGEVFETPEVGPAIQHPKCPRIDFGDRKVEMASTLLEVPNEKARPLGADPKLGFDRADELGQLRR